MHAFRCLLHLLYWQSDSLPLCHLSPHTHGQLIYDKKSKEQKTERQSSLINSVEKTKQPMQKFLKKITRSLSHTKYKINSNRLKI